MNAPRLPDRVLKAKVIRLVREDPDVRTELMKLSIQLLPTRQETNAILRRIDELRRVIAGKVDRLSARESQ